MGYRNLAECVRDLERHGYLVEIDEEVDPHLEAAAIQAAGFMRQRDRRCCSDV